MHISKIATIEIPVTNLQRSVYWYTETLQLSLIHHDESSGTAMLSLSSKGEPTLYLVEVEEHTPLSFYNEKTKVTHSVIDFYTRNLHDYHAYLSEQGVEVGSLPIEAGKQGGFGFQDPDGNWLSVCNINPVP
ncbi:VOC family protein [Pseudalkalibacillus hwajinpoensis]|uniref:VOC family protein n=1 Tax=Guptibacillus hwajinpoensis TaxID=208199 RepID=UPI00325C0FC4